MGPYVCFSTPWTGAAGPMTCFGQQNAATWCSASSKPRHQRGLCLLALPLGILLSCHANQVASLLEDERPHRSEPRPRHGKQPSRDQPTDPQPNMETWQNSANPAELPGQLTGSQAKTNKQTNKPTNKQTHTWLLFWATKFWGSLLHNWYNILWGNWVLHQTTSM